MTPAGTGAPRTPRRLTWRLHPEDHAGLALRTDWPAGDLTDWAWGGASGSGASVCIIDSGVEPDHPAVGPVQAAYAVEAGPDGRPRVVEDGGGDVCGHGTACAGVVRSLAPSCGIVSVRVLGGLTGTGDVLVTGLRWAIAQRYDVINLSLSTTRQRFAQTLHELADDAYFDRTLLVASAHNTPVESFPWRFSSVISVGSHAEPDPWRFYYNPVPPVEFFARGVDVPVAWLAGERTRCSGNSFATPHVTGLCALIRGKHPDLTPFQVKNVLYLTASNVRNRKVGPDESP